MSKVHCCRGLGPRDPRSSLPRDPRSSLPVKSPVCRNLFGFVDHEELQRDLTQTLREICARDRDRWNFNFELSSPQDGIYEWRQVSAQDLPEFYRDSVRSGRTRVPAGPANRSPAEEPQTPVSLSSQSPVSLSPESLSSQTPVSLSPVSLSPESLSSQTLVSLSSQSPVSLSPEFLSSQSPVSLSLEFLSSQTPVSLSSPFPVSRRRTHAPRTAAENRRITDFFVKRKKVVDRKAADVKLLIRPEHTEQTQRKRLR